jgi:hypothetical protein
MVECQLTEEDSEMTVQEFMTRAAGEAIRLCPDHADVLVALTPARALLRVTIWRNGMLRSEASRSIIPADAEAAAFTPEAWVQILMRNHQPNLPSQPSASGD